MVHLPFSADDQRYHVRPDPARNFVHYLANKPLAITILPGAAIMNIVRQRLIAKKRRPIETQ
jgi:hypothetical protein